MTEHEIKVQLGCPTNTELKDHIKNIKLSLKAMTRDEVLYALDLLRDWNPRGNLADDRIAVASNVHLNPEWQEYVKVTIANVRNTVLANDDSNDFNRGVLAALSGAERYFRSKYNFMKKPKS